MMLVVRRWLPAVEMTLVGGHTYSVLELSSACTRRGVRLVAPLRLDAALYAPAPPCQPGMTGRSRVKGKRLPTLAQVLTDRQTLWQRLERP
jgi:hypothetical protein